MPNASRVVVIERPVDAVFAFFTDPANDRRWRPAVADIAAEGPPGVGRRIRQSVAGPGKRTIPADIEVTAYEPPARYGFRAVAGPVRPVGEYRFASVEGGTEVAFSLRADVTGLKRLFMAKPVQASMDAEVAALDTAKALLESD